MVLDLARRVSDSVDETKTGKFAPAEVTIATRTKGTLKRRIEQVPGTPRNPMTDAELHAKFRDCASSGAAPMTAAQTEKVIAGVAAVQTRSGEHTSEPQSLMRTSYALLPVKTTTQHLTPTP